MHILVCELGQTLINRQGKSRLILVSMQSRYPCIGAYSLLCFYHEQLCTCFGSLRLEPQA